MKYYCPRCYTKLIITRWKKKPRRVPYTILYLCCPCCGFAMRDYDFASDAQPCAGIEPDGRPMKAVSLLDIPACQDKKLRTQP